jgi:tetratricopeptide (TPR) repeat protein
MFATHPMSDERYQNAVQNSQTKYATAQSLPLNRERYMDHTARLRAMKATVEELQKGEQEMNRQKLGEAEAHFRNALKQTPNDYAGLVMMATSQIIQKKPAEGLRYSEAAKSVYPQEAQAYYLSGFAKLQTRNFAGAYQDLGAYERVLPGNPTTVFFKGFSLEGMEKKPEAAQEYHRYLQVVREGKFAQHAYARLVEWGYYKR